MLCPQNNNKDFDDLDCRDCKWFFQCFKMWQNGNIWGKDKTIGDNYPVIPKEKKSPTDTEKTIINALAQEIKDYGEERVWNNLNTIPIDKRLDYLELFLSAKHLLETGEY
jgi:hypothetical protein